MDQAVTDILDALRSGVELDRARLDAIIRKHSKRAHDGRRIFAKKRILSYYLGKRAAHDTVWESWDVDQKLDAQFVQALQMKPRRTASGVATITVITKPYPCRNHCIYCPNDPEMPKSYLSDEPACQRAQRTFFHPYLQVASRLRTLGAMGHATDKIELIVLGGTWTDYPADYRTWFISELFRALNDAEDVRESALSHAYENGALPSAEGESIPLDKVHADNETCDHRVVGLVVETRPDSITCESLSEMRQLGCTKVQMGIQSIDPDILRVNGRRETPDSIAEALALCRLFGFKTHTHFMLNLLGATPESDVRDYRTFATDASYMPDEVKIYPCALVAGTGLVEAYERGDWRPYSEEELIDTLCADMRVTPPFTRVSRMIRDISAKDILVGNKKTNLRQLVDEKLAKDHAPVSEIRFREIGTEPVSLDDLHLDDVTYETTATREHFLQWVTPDNRIVGFLRLSLPRAEALERYKSMIPIRRGEAMIREVHVYGFATRIDEQGTSAQHHGLGRKLVERACDIAHDAGYHAVNVISAIGTREYYRKLGFEDSGLYQQKPLP